MAERVTVRCPEGHAFTTAVRGRGTHCPTPCGRTVYVRTDGTVRTPGEPAPPSPPAAAEDWTDYELWEIAHVDGDSAEELAEESGLPVATVRRRIAAEERRRRRAGLDPDG